MMKYDEILQQIEVFGKEPSIDMDDDWGYPSFQETAIVMLL